MVKKLMRPSGCNTLDPQTKARSEPRAGPIILKLWVLLRKLKEEDGPSVRLKIGPFSGSDSEQVAHEPRLADRIFLCYPPDSALPNHVDRLDTL